MKCSSKSHARKANTRRTGSRPLLELLESRLQPGSIVMGQGPGWSLLSDNFAVVEQTPSRSDSLVSQSSSDRYQPARSSTRAAAPGDPVAASIATVSKSESTNVPSQRLADAFAAGWVNDDLSVLLAAGRPSSVPLLATEASVSSVKLTSSAPPSAGVSESPIGIATPPTPQSNLTTAQGMALSPIALTPTQLPMPTVTSIASSVHTANLQSIPLNVQGTPVSGGVTARMTVQNFSTFLGGVNQDSIAGVAVDNPANNGGNIYVAGSFEIAPGVVDILAASLDPTGSTVRWAKAIPGSEFMNQASGIAVLDSGPGDVKVYVTGYLGNTDPVSQKDGLLLQLDGTNGSIDNAVFVPDSYFEGVALDPNGNVFVTGTAIDPNSGAQNILTAGFDPALDLPALYAKTLSVQDADMHIGTSAALGSHSIAVDANDNTYIIGTFAPKGSTDFSPVVVGYNGGSDQLLWQPVHYANLIAPGPGYGGSIAYQGGSIFVTTTLFDNSTVTPLSSDLLLAKLDATSGSQVYGTQWVVTDGMPTPTRIGDWTGNGIAVNAAGEPIVVGAAFDPLGDDTFPATKGVDVHVTHFGASGTTAQLPDGRPENTFGGSSVDIGNAIILDPANSNNAIVVGMTQSSDFPTTAGVYAPNYVGGASDGFVTSVPI